MQLTPRYHAPPALQLEDAIDDPTVPLLRQRRRLGVVLQGLADEQWSAPSRCEGWSVQDVIVHLISTNQFWALSVTSGLAGEPTCFLATFDPVASPAALVATQRSLSPSEVLERYQESTEDFAAAVAGLDAPALERIAEAPPGHVAIRAVLLHALWDAWIHERDVVLPLGLDPVEEPDEVAACLGYAAALGPALLATRGSTRAGTLAIRATDPALSFVVEVGPTAVVRPGDDPGAPALVGEAVDLVEALSFRAPLPAGLPADSRWLLGGLGEVFDL